MTRLPEKFTSSVTKPRFTSSALAMVNLLFSSISAFKLNLCESVKSGVCCEKEQAGAYLKWRNVSRFVKCVPIKLTPMAEM